MARLGRLTHESGICGPPNGYRAISHKDSPFSDGSMFSPNRESWHRNCCEEPLGVVSVQTGDGAEKPSARSIITLEEAPPVRAHESDDRSSTADRLGWRVRYHSSVSFLVVLTFVSLTLIF